jgi:hypothetical protein
MTRSADGQLRLLLSARTVEWHLRNVFGKLGIGSQYRTFAVPPAQLKTRGHVLILVLLTRE